MATRQLVNIAMSGAGASYLTYHLTSSYNRTQSARALDYEYSQEVQDGMAFIGATKNYLAAHGVELTEFMREFPHSKAYPVGLGLACYFNQLMNERTLRPGHQKQFQGTHGQNYLTLELWLEVRSACHKLNGFWDSFLAGIEYGAFPQDLDDEHSPGIYAKDMDGRSIIQLKGRWANRGKNFTNLIEPLEHANFLYMQGRGDYKTPSRFAALDEAYHRYEEARKRKKDEVPFVAKG